jgi:hypothetical protein
VSAVRGFRQHGRTSGESSSHVLADRDRHIGQERYLDTFLDSRPAIRRFLSRSSLKATRSSLAK